MGVSGPNPGKRRSHAIETMDLDLVQESRNYHRGDYPENERFAPMSRDLKQILVDKVIAVEKARMEFGHRTPSEDNWMDIVEIAEEIYLNDLHKLGLTI